MHKKFGDNATATEKKANERLKCEITFFNYVFALKQRLMFLLRIVFC